VALSEGRAPEMMYGVMQAGMKDAALLQAAMLAAASHDNLTRLESQQRELREMSTAHQALIAEREAARQTLDR
jgi:hypothetical protein